MSQNGQSGTELANRLDDRDALESLRRLKRFELAQARAAATEATLALLRKEIAEAANDYAVFFKSQLVPKYAIQEGNDELDPETGTIRRGQRVTAVPTEGPVECAPTPQA
jgi:hypothetical protein